MKSLVVYSSKSGNTKKLAEAVYGYLSGEKEICAVEDAPDPAGYSFVAVGFWLQGGNPDAESQIFLAKIKEGQDLYLFATHAAAVGSPHAKNGMNAAKSIAGKGHVIGTFSCLGEVPEKILEMVAQKDPPPPWLADAPAAVGHPNARDVANVVRMLEEMDIP
jgi:flavodoxin